VANGVPGRRCCACFLPPRFALASYFSVFSPLLLQMKFSVKCVVSWFLVGEDKYCQQVLSR
jgi:hypothetical protein